PCHAGAGDLLVGVPDRPTPEDRLALPIHHELALVGEPEHVPDQCDLGVRLVLPELVPYRGDGEPDHRRGGGEAPPGPELLGGPEEPCRDLYAQGREDRLQGLPLDERHQRQDEDEVEHRDGSQEAPTSPSRIAPWPPHQPHTDDPDEDDRREEPEHTQWMV